MTPNFPNPSYPKLHAIIGDLDSVTPETRAYFQSTTFIIKDSDQDTTDFTKAFNHLYHRSLPLTARMLSGPAPSSSRFEEITAAREQVFGEEDIVVLGGIGGRIDQGLSVLHHLYIIQTSLDCMQDNLKSDSDSDSWNRGVYMISSENISMVLGKGSHQIRAKQSVSADIDLQIGGHCGIIPLKEPVTITTKGLKWDVKNYKTEMGGKISTSNYVKDNYVYVKTSGPVLFTIQHYQKSTTDGVHYNPFAVD